MRAIYVHVLTGLGDDAWGNQLLNNLLALGLGLAPSLSTQPSTFIVDPIVFQCFDFKEPRGIVFILSQAFLPPECASSSLDGIAASFSSWLDTTLICLVFYKALSESQVKSVCNLESHHRVTEV